MKLDAVPQAYAVNSHRLFLWMIKPDVPVVPLNPALNGMSSLSNVNLSILTENAINTWCFQDVVVLNESKQSGNIPRQEA